MDASGVRGISGFPQKQVRRKEHPDVADNEYIDITCPNCREELSYTKEQLQSGDVVCPMCDIHISL